MPLIRFPFSMSQTVLAFSFGQPLQIRFLLPIRKEMAPLDGLVHLTPLAFFLVHRPGRNTLSLLLALGFPFFPSLHYTRCEDEHFA